MTRELIGRRPWMVVSLSALIVAATSWLWIGSNPFAQATAQELESPQVSERAIQGAERLSDAFRSAASILRPSVVTITSLVEQSARPRRRSVPDFGGIPDDLRQFFPDDLLDELQPRGRRYSEEPDDEEDEGPKRKVQTGVGSGVIVSADGFILTNNHVVSRADELQVELTDGRSFKAEIVGTDDKSDVAVLKIDAQNLAPAKLGDSSQMDVGDWVIAVGSPFGLDQTVTAGIISATHRSFGILNNPSRRGYEDFLQTDAAINPGNSGGPLVNLRGEVVGINTAINSRTGYNAGVGFAIPSNMASRIMQDLRERGRVVRGYVGLSIGNVSYEQAQELKLPDGRTQGAYVDSVIADGPAAEAQIQPEDVIVSVDGRNITSSEQFRNMVAMTRPGTRLNVQAYRNGRPVQTNITVGELTDEKIAQFNSARPITFPALGIRVAALNSRIKTQLGVEDNVEGIVVLAVDGRGLGSFMGLEAEDVILSLNGKDVRDPTSFAEAFESQDSSGRIRMRLWRNGEIQTLIATVR